MTIEVASDGSGRWVARSASDVVGEVRSFTRPDGRTFLSLRDCDDDAYRPLLETAVAELRRDVYVSVPEQNDLAIRRLKGIGFRVTRRDHHYRVPVDPTRHRSIDRPSRISLVSAADADLDRLRLLDDELRNATPGTDGWRWIPADFRDETFSDGFTPATYQVAIDSHTADYVGLARVWVKPSGPRFGYVGVLPDWRRTRVTHLLLSTVFGELHQRGHTSVTAEIDATNRASNAIAGRAGAVRIGGSLELVRDETSSANTTAVPALHA